MSTKSIFDKECDSFASASATRSKPTKDIENDGRIRMNYTEKFAQICRDLKLLDKAISTNGDKYSNNQMDMSLKLEKYIDQSFHELTNSKDPNFDDMVVLAQSFIIMYHIQLPEDTSEQEYLYGAELSLIRSMTLLKNKELDRKAILGAIVTLNELSNLHMKLKNLKRSSQYLKKALELYMIYTKGQDVFPAPINILNIIGIEDKSNTLYLLNRKYMNTLKSLIMLNDKIQHGLIDMEKITTYMHNLLKKQLENIPITVDHISWAREAIRLAEYFLSCERFMECKNHLVVASVAAKYFNDYYKMYVRMSAKKKNFLHCQYMYIISIIDTCWVRYGLALLYSSRKHMLKQEGRNNFSSANSYEAKSIVQSIKQSTESLLFTCSEKEYKDFMYIANDNYIINYNDAKIIFVRILQLVNKIKTNKFISEESDVCAELAQYVSKAYKYLAFYEHDKINQIKLQKRRIEILEDCLKTLNVEDDRIYCSFIWLELAVINSNVLNINIENVDQDKLTVGKLAEIDQLVKNTVNYFKLFNENSDAVQYGLANDVVDKNYQVISSINIKYNSMFIND